MKKIISTYLIFVFMLMTFSGCERIKNSLGLSPANAEIPDNSNKAENPPTQQLTQETQIRDSSSNEEPVVEKGVVSKDPEIPESESPPEVKPKQDSQQVMQPMSKADTAWKNAGVAHTKTFILCVASIITSKISSGQYLPVQLPFPVLVVSTAAQAYFFVSGLYYGAKGVYYSCTENKKDERKD